ncbi:MAG: hypothetical protein ACOZNI_31015 [Myxococcota bacterium]
MLLLALFACTGDEPPAGADGVEERPFSDCDPISYDYCALPYPSSFYLREDATTETGWRVHLGASTIPRTENLDVQPDPWPWNELDGFSPLNPLLARFPDLSVENLPGHDDIEASLADDSPIVLFDWDTGERHPFFAELDVSGEHIPGREFLFVRPAKPMLNGHRYVVAMRDLVDTSGAVIPASEGYAALRDGTETTDWDIEGRRELYADLFSRLEEQGWDPSETQLAWDFVVGSKEKITGRARFMIDDALATVGQDGPDYVIDEVVQIGDGNTAYRVYGSMTVPLYTEEDRTGTWLTRDDEGMPYQNGTTTVPFTIVVPQTAVDDPRPLKLLQYGHGLLGEQDEVHSGYLGEMANRYGLILFAVDWTGMKSEDDQEIAAMIVQNVGEFGKIPERSHQGFVEFACAAAMMQGAMASDAVFAYTDDTGATGSLIDPSTVWYYGNSQGAILGGAYLALAPQIDRGVLGVGGMPYSLLLSRSADFTPFFALFQAVYHEQEDISFWMALMQNLWDGGEAGGYGLQMSADPLEGRSAKAVLVQDAIGDAQVTTLGAHVMGRAYDGVLIDPPVRDVWGLETVSGGWEGSALVEFEHGAPEVPYENLPPDSQYDTHEDTRRTLAAQEQLWTFLSEGRVEQYCDGACDPE